MASVLLRDFVVTKGEDKLTLYQWNTNVAKHYFCSVCGIYTHHQRRSKPDEYAINVSCLEGPDPTIGKSIGMLDGASNSIVETAG
jgi:hypothetical protein